MPCLCIRRRSAYQVSTLPMPRQCHRLPICFLTSDLTNSETWEKFPHFPVVFFFFFFFGGGASLNLLELDPATVSRQDGGKQRSRRHLKAKLANKQAKASVPFWSSSYWKNYLDDGMKPFHNSTNGL